MSVTLTEESIKRYVQIMLGAPVINIELVNEQLTQCIDTALDAYGDARPIIKRSNVVVNEAQQAYTLATFGKGVINVYKEDPLRMTVELSEFDIFKYNQFQFMNVDPGDYYLRKQWREEVKKAVGSDDDWEFDPITGMLFISPSPTQSYNLVYDYVINPTLTEVPASDDNIVKNYTLALAKMIIGRIYRKFGGIPGAEQPIVLDGDKLMEEGKQDLKDLELELAKSGSRCSPIRG